MVLSFARERRLASGLDGLRFWRGISCGLYCYLWLLKLKTLFQSPLMMMNSVLNLLCLLSQWLALVGLTAKSKELRNYDNCTVYLRVMGGLGPDFRWRVG